MLLTLAASSVMSRFKPSVLLVIGRDLESCTSLRRGHRGLRDALLRGVVVRERPSLLCVGRRMLLFVLESDGCGLRYGGVFVVLQLCWAKLLLTPLECAAKTLPPVV